MANIGALLGLRVLVVGLGKEGEAVARYLAKQGITVAATDMKTEADLGETKATLETLGVSLTLGQHPDALLDEADILFVSPGVPLEVPFLEEARVRNIPLSTESRLFCHLCPAPIIAITGSSGKTTTTTLVGKMLQADGRKAWVGGNIGRPLIEVVDQIRPTDAVVMELSSFQLEYFHARLNKNVPLDILPAKNRPELDKLLDNWSPPVSAILNVTPNHLDRHPSIKHYVRAKRAVIDYQNDSGVVVMGLDNDMTRTIGNRFGDRVRWFSLEAHIPGGAGVIGKDLVFLDSRGKSQVIVNRQDIKLRGDHNVRNILAACLLAREAGASIEAMAQVATSFTGVEHRLQLVAEHNQVSYYNDSISTSPERVMAALRSFTEPIVLLVGGRDKQLPWNDVARLMLKKTRAVIIFGEAAPIIATALKEATSELDTTSNAQVRECAGFDDAVQMAVQMAEPGNVVLLSPGCASYDAFTDYTKRGERFKELVTQLK